jgi:hypothetical protein
VKRAVKALGVQHVETNQIDASILPSIAHATGACNGIVAGGQYVQ